MAKHQIWDSEGNLIYEEELPDAPALLMEHWKDVREYGAKCDKATLDTQAVQDTVNSLIGVGGVVFIPYGTVWKYRNITHPDEVLIMDYSGYDWDERDWTGQLKFITKTVSPETKNANEFKIISHYHPAVILDIVGATKGYRSSVVWRREGKGYWQIADDPPNNGLAELHIQQLRNQNGEFIDATRMSMCEQGVGVMRLHPEFPLDIRGATRVEGNPATIILKSLLSDTLVKKFIRLGTYTNDFEIWNSADTVKILTITNAGNAQFSCGVSGGAFTSDKRPAANSVKLGTSIFDSTLNKPIWSNGTQWVDAIGNVV